MRDKPLFITSVIFLILYILFLVAVFSPLRNIFSPFITTLVLVYLMLPAVKFLKKFKIKGVIATFIVYFLILAGGLFAVLYAIPKIYGAVTEVGDIIGQYFDITKLKRMEGGLFSGGIRGVYTTIVSATKGVLNVLVGCVAAFYILSDAEGVKKALKEFVPEKLKPAFMVLIDDVKLSFDSFFKGQVLIGGVLFVIVGIFLYALKIPYSWGLAFIMAVLDIVPYAGAFIAMGVIILVTLISAADKVIIVIIGLLIIQQVENNIITPKISSDTLALHPAVTVLALYVGSFGGFWGILLAIPLVCVFRKICQRFIQSII